MLSKSFQSTFINTRILFISEDEGDVDPWCFDHFDVWHLCLLPWYFHQKMQMQIINDASRWRLKERVVMVYERWNVFSLSPSVMWASCSCVTWVLCCSCRLLHALAWGRASGAYTDTSEPEGCVISPAVVFCASSCVRNEMSELERCWMTTWVIQIAFVMMVTAVY